MQYNSKTDTTNKIKTVEYRGVTIKQYYVDNPDDSISLTIILNVIRQIKDNFYELSHTSNLYNFMNNLTIELWNPNRKDIGQIRDYAGLTWASNKMIHLKGSYIGTVEQKIKYYDNLLSHELGHYFAHYVGFNDKINPMYNVWENARGKHSTKSTPRGELIAEDFRLFFGGYHSRKNKRGDYKQATEVQGLKWLYLLYYSAYHYFNFHKKCCNFENIDIKYSDSSFSKCRLQFYSKNKFQYLSWFSDYYKSYWISISENHFFRYENGSWKAYK